MFQRLSFVLTTRRLAEGQLKRKFDDPGPRKVWFHVTGQEGSLVINRRYWSVDGFYSFQKGPYFFNQKVISDFSIGVMFSSDSGGSYTRDPL